MRASNQILQKRHKRKIETSKKVAYNVNNIFDILEGLAALREQPFINMGLPRGQVMTDYSRGTEYTHFLAYPASPYRS